MANLAQRSFATGELAPALYARTDLQKYTSAVKTCRNFIIQRDGGAFMRPGTDYVGTVDNLQQGVRLIKFVFNSTDALVMEFGQKYIKFYAGGGLVFSKVTTPYLQADLSTIRYAQQGDIVTLTHPNYPPAELKRFSDTNWTYTPIVFGPSIPPPTNLTLSGGTQSGIGAPILWLVSAIDLVTGDESLVSNPVLAVLIAGEPNATHPIVLNWTQPVSGTVGHYNVYRSAGGGGYGAYALVGQATNQTFTDTGQTPDPTQNPPTPFTGFSSVGNYPAVCGFYQQRRLFANTNNEPGTVWCSRIGSYNDFGVHTILQDDDAVIFSLATDEPTSINAMINIGRLVIGAEGGEWLVNGDSAGALTPTTINLQIGSSYGMNGLRPVKAGNSILYIQSLGNRVLKLKTNIYLGYYTFEGKDLTVYSTHLFDGYSITDWDYAQIPNYLTVAVRSDGTLLGFTFDEDEQLSAWHRHDTQGVFESVCVIPEGGEHRIYVVVRRTINGETVRYIERFRSLTLLDVVNDAAFMDSILEYDGRNASNAGTVLTLNGSGWTETDPLTLTASVAEFTAANVGDARFLYDAVGNKIVATIATFLSTTQVTVFPDKDVPASLQGLAAARWDRAPLRFAGADTLEGEKVAIYADGYVIGSPNNPTAQIFIVGGGQVVLDQPRAHVKIGLPYLADIQTLEIDTPQGPSLKETRLAITGVGIYVVNSRGVWAGETAPSGADATAGLREFKWRNLWDDPTVPPPAQTGYNIVDISADWLNHGSIFLRQIDPVPLNLLAVMPSGFVPANN